MLVNVDPIQGNSKNILRFSIAAACAGLPVTQVQAAIEEIIVTSTKREANMQSIPIAVTAFDDQEIVRQGFKTFSDYVGQIPSLSVVERQPGATNVLMRGCAAQGLTFADSATTSIYLDEQPITAAGYNPDPRLIDIARVEALGGPQGTLFGDAAQCGTLRIITNKPDTTALSGFVDLTGDTVDNGGTGYDLNGMVNIPLVQDKLALRLVGFVGEEAGWVDNVLSPSPGSDPALGVDPAENFDNSAFVRDDVNTNSFYGGRASLRWTPAEKWTADFVGIYQKKELDGFADADLNNTSPNTLNMFSDTSVFPTLGEYDQIRFGTDDWEDEWYQAAITVEGDVGFADLVVTGAYFNRSSSYNADSTTYLQAFQQLGDYYFPAYNIYDFNGDPRATAFDGRDTDSFSFEARLSSDNDADSRWNWLGGVFYNQRNVDELFTSNVKNLWNAYNSYNGLGDTTPAGYYINYSYYNANAPSSQRSDNWFTGTYDAKLTQVAVFGEFTVAFAEYHSFTAGGRFYDIENDYTVVQAALVGLDGGIPDCTIDYCYTGANDVGEGKDDGFVPKLNYTWAKNDKLAYATYSEGFRRGGVNSARPPSVFSSPGTLPPPTGIFNEYDADTVQNFEIGTKTEWLNNTLRFNLTTYIMKWDDIQVQVEDTITDSFALGILNAPEAEIFGADAWLGWAPTDNWDFDATIGYNKAEISEDFVFDGNVLVADGTALPLMPDWKGSLNGTFTFSGELLSATPYILAQYVYWGESTNSLGTESSSFVFPIKDQPAWQTLALRIGLDGEKWSATAYVDNIFNEYQEMFYNNRFAQQRLSVGQPRTFGLNFRRSFGSTGSN